MNRQLPERPDLEQLRAQAKELLESLHNGDEEAKQRFLAFSSDLGPKVTLSQAQFTLAREFGYPSWPRLKQHVEFVTSGAYARAQAFVSAATGSDPKRAKALLEEDPNVATYGLAPALVLGDLPTVRKILTQDPSALQSPTEFQGRTPLIVAAASALLNDPEYGPRVLDLIRWLIAAGAEVSQTVSQPFNGSEWQMSALYGACGISRNPAAAKILLDAGADVNDNESLYHSTESRDHSCLKLLLDHSVRLTGTNGISHMLDYDDPVGLRLMLEHGARTGETPMNLGSEHLLMQAIRRGRSAEIAEMLIEFGADPNETLANGLSLYAFASRIGNEAVASVIRRHARPETLPPGQRLIAAAARGDLAECKAIMSSEPTAFDEACEDRNVLAELATVPNRVGVLTLLQIGFPVDGLEPEHKATALHWAGHRGDLELTEQILLRNPPLDLTDNMYLSPPIGWAIHGGCWMPTPGGKYPEVIRAMFEAGAKLPDGVDWKKLPNPEIATVVQAMANPDGQMRDSEKREEGSGEKGRRPQVVVLSPR